MDQERTLSFGKYKDQEVKYIILTHIGYIMWCFENLQWFKLTDKEQALYDAIAIMIKKDNIEMTFPVELMYKHVKNREAFTRLETPFINFNGCTSFKESENNNSICRSVEKYVISEIKIPNRNCGLSSEGLLGLIHSMDKDIEESRTDGYTDDVTFGGWSSINDY